MNKMKQITRNTLSACVMCYFFWTAVSLALGDSHIFSTTKSNKVWNVQQNGGRESIDCSIARTMRNDAEAEQREIR